MDISESEDIMCENELEKRLIEAAEKAKAASMTFTSPRDYIDIGKKLGVSSTFGMELNAAASKAYNEWKERHKDDGSET